MRDSIIDHPPQNLGISFFGFLSNISGYRIYQSWIKLKEIKKREERLLLKIKEEKEKQSDLHEQVTELEHNVNEARQEFEELNLMQHEQPQKQRLLASHLHTEHKKQKSTDIQFQNNISVTFFNSTRQNNKDTTTTSYKKKSNLEKIKQGLKELTEGQQSIDARMDDAETSLGQLLKDQETTYRKQQLLLRS